MSGGQLVKANQVGPGTKGKSPGAMVSYMDRGLEPEPEKKPEPESGQAEPTREPDRRPEPEPEPTPAFGRARFGDRGAFVAAALARAKERTAYVHVVVSPVMGGSFENRDFLRLLEPWTRDLAGRECAYYATVHRNTPHPHLHVAAARDRFSKKELERLKRETRDRIAEVERLREGLLAGLGRPEGTDRLRGVEEAPTQEKEAREEGRRRRSA